MKKIKIFLISLLLFAPVALMAQMRGGYGYPGSAWGFCGYPGFGGLIMLIVTIIILGLLIFFGIKMIKSGQGNPFAAQDPMAILKARYAKGEITKEQFQEMKKDLM